MRHAVPRAAIVAAFLLSCAGAPPADPSLEHPLFGCILPKPGATQGGKRLPEIVKVVGVTPIDDGARWKVLRGPNFNPDEWEPHSREEIVFGVRCGPERQAFQDMLDASRGDVTAGARSLPPNN